MKRRKELIPLSEQHHHGLVAARRVRRMIATGLDAGESRKLYAEVVEFHQADIESHFRAEEMWILPALAERAPALGERVRADHRLLRDLANRKADDNPTQVLTVWADTLVAHIRFEERELFEVAQKLLTEEELAAIGAKLSKPPRKPRLPGK